MKILVCVKPVAETEAFIRIAPDGSAVQTDPLTPLRMNRYDEIALEQALLIRDDFPGTRIDVISAGPHASEAVLKRALGMGADHGIHILAEIKGCAEPAIVAEWIAAAARSRAYDLLLAGVMSEDGLHGMVGPLLAEHLFLPCTTAAVRIRIIARGSVAAVERAPAEGLREVLELTLPAVLTLQACSRRPRYPSLSNILRAKEQGLEVIAAPPIRTKIFEHTARFRYPQKSRTGRFLEGSPQQKAQELVHVLREKSFLD